MRHNKFAQKLWRCPCLWFWNPNSVSKINRMFYMRMANNTPLHRYLIVRAEINDIMSTGIRQVGPWHAICFKLQHEYGTFFIQLSNIISHATVDNQALLMWHKNGPLGLTTACNRRLKLKNMPMSLRYRKHMAWYQANPEVAAFLQISPSWSSWYNNVLANVPDMTSLSFSRNINAIQLLPLSLHI